MKKVLVVCHMGRHYRKFGHYDIKPLQELGYEVHFAANFTMDIDKVDDDSIILHQIDFQRSPFSLKNIQAYYQIKKLIESNDFDLIHCQSPVGGVLTRLANQRLKHKCRILYTAHGFHFYKGSSIVMWLLFYPIEKWLSKYTDVLITINQEDYNLAKTNFSKRCNNIQYIPGIGLDVKKYKDNISQNEKENLISSLGLINNDIILTCVARLDKNKNQRFLINIMERLLLKYNNIHLLLVGNDELNGYYQRIVKKKKLESNIHFLGNRNDVPQLLSISDVVLSSSKREGLPINVMEAMAAGKPIVALNCRGMKDLLSDGINGYVVDNDYDFLCRIGDLISNQALRTRIEHNNKIKVNEYDSKHIIKVFKHIITNYERK